MNSKLISVFRKALFIIFISLVSWNYVNARGATDTCMLIRVNDSMFNRHLIALKKLDLIESIARRHYADKSIIFYFANPQLYLTKGTTLLVLDDSNVIIEGFQMPNCCDSTVFDSKEKLKKKFLKRLDKIGSMISLNANEFYDCLIGYDSSFDVLLFVRNGKVQSGLLIGDRGPSSSENNPLLRIRECIKSSIL